MCLADMPKDEEMSKVKPSDPIVMDRGIQNQIRRRRKRDKDGSFTPRQQQPNEEEEITFQIKKEKKRSKSLQKHGADKPSGGVEALVPSLIGVALLACIITAKMGFRGRATVAGIDLGTTNSVICVQAPSKTVGEIECMRDPASPTNSPIVPSVVSFLEPSEWSSKKKKKDKELPDLYPPPSHVIVGTRAKLRINTHPHHTMYNAKRVLGRSYSHEATQVLRQEVEFDIVPNHSNTTKSNGEGPVGVAFRLSHHNDHDYDSNLKSNPNTVTLKPQQVGSYIVHHLMEMAKHHLGHDNVKSAVIAVPAKFNALQRQATVEAFRGAGVKVARILEEPQAAALAYGLHKKDGVDYILVYDFGGGTLDVSILYVSEGFVDVMGSDGDDELGGADFDAAIAHFLLEQRGDAVSRVSNALVYLETQLQISGGGDFEEVLAASCPALGTTSTPLCTVSSFHTIGEQLKIGLSAHPEGGAVVEAECMSLPPNNVDSNLSEKGLTIDKFCQALESTPLSLTSEEYSAATKDLLARSSVPIQRLLADLNLRKDEIDEVVMVGGTTRMPQIRKLVQEELDVVSLNTHIDPDLTVAYGAASVID